MFYGSNSLGNKDFKLSYVLSLNIVNVYMEYGQLGNMSLQFGMIELESSISATLSVLLICSEEECSEGSFPKQWLVIEPSWKFYFKLLLIKGM